MAEVAVTEPGERVLKLLELVSSAERLRRADREAAMLRA